MLLTTQASQDFQMETFWFYWSLDFEISDYVRDEQSPQIDEDVHTEYCMAENSAIQYCKVKSDRV